MKKLILASAILAAFGANLAHAADAADAADAAPAPEHSLSYNVGVASEYRYRGISQSRFQPAYSVGFDYAHNPSGLYLSAWASTIKWIKDGGATDGKYEIDFYGGKKGEIAPDVGYDIGGLYYLYPKNTYGNVPGYSNANTFELYGKINKGPFYLKYSHSLSDLFGFQNSRNSYYIDGGADLPLTEGLVLNLHVGHQKVANLSAADFTDYKVGVTKDFGFVSASAAYIAADSNKAVYYSPNGTNTGKANLVVSLTKTF